jgi:putative ABC transport system ATP-binding protein
MKINLRNLYKYFETPAGQHRVLERVNLDVEKGRFICIMGPSGTGKSTLLFLIGCLDTPSFGNIFLDDVDVSEESESVRERIRLHHIGFIFQNYNLLPTLTVMENVLLPMQLAGSMKRKVHSTNWVTNPVEWANRAQTLLRLVDLDKKTDDRVTNLSGGEQQRVAIARALANSPGLLLADEPTGNLDSSASKQIMEVLRAIHKSQKLSIILVTHDPKIASYADQIYYLDEGKLRSTVF